MLGWNLATYVIAAVIVAVLLIAIAFHRAGAAKRSVRHRHVPSSSVDPFYLDSSHAGEPRTQDSSSP
jgi:hypothetical protein